MAWTDLTDVTTGELATASLHNQLLEDVRVLRAGGLAPSGAAALDFLYMSTSTQVGTLTAVAGKVPKVNAAGSAWEMGDAAPPAHNNPVLVGGTRFGFGGV